MTAGDRNADSALTMRPRFGRRRGDPARTRERVFHATLLLLVASVLCSGCRGHSGAPARTDTSLPAIPASTSATSASPASTSTTLPLVTPQITPDAAAAALLDAWQRGDRAAGEHLGSPAAVAAIFQLQPRPTNPRGCQDPIAGNSMCAYMYGDALLQLRTVTLGAGWTVQEVVAP